MNQSELKLTCNQRQAQENACDQLTMIFGFTSFAAQRVAK